jgi:predicted Zn-dependent protease
MPSNPDHLLRAAQGYYELGMDAAARAELDALPPEWAGQAEALELRLMLLMRERRWAEALGLALELQGVQPEAGGGFVHAAFCLHEMGRTAEARAMLLAGPSELREEGLFYYNLACYEARLGMLGEAREHLARSIRIDVKFRALAAGDPDLEPLRSAP